MDDVLKYQKLDPLFQSYYTSAKHHRQTFDTHWNDYFKMYEGHQWDERLPRYKAKITVNKIFAIIEHKIGVMTTNKPRIYIEPKVWTDSAKKVANALEYFFHVLWAKGNMQEKLVEGCRFAAIVGTGIWKVHLAENNEIVVDTVHPNYFYIDPSATSIDDAMFVIHEQPLHIDYAKMLYPDFREIIDAHYQKMKHDIQSANIVFKSEIEKPIVYPYIKVAEMWLKDWSLDEDGRLLYPGGRIITFFPEPMVVISDITSPFKHKRFPFVAMQWYKVPGRFWGISEVQLLRTMQYELNKRISQIQDNLNLMNNAIWIIDKNSGVDPDTLTNEPGLVVPKNPGTEVRREFGQPIQQSAFLSVADIIRRMEDISGVTDIVRGESLKSHTTAGAVETLMSAGQVRLRLTLDSFEQALTNMGELIISLMQQFYVGKRNYRYIDEEGEEQFSQIDLTQDAIGEYDFKITAGSTMPLSRMALIQQALLLYNLHIIDAQALLEILDFPGKEKILKRLKQKGEEGTKRGRQPAKGVISALTKLKI